MQSDLSAHEGHYLFVDCVAFVFRILAQLFRCFPLKKSTNALLTICKQTQSNLYFPTIVKRHSYTFCAKFSMQVLNLCLQITGHSRILLHKSTDLFGTIFPQSLSLRSTRVVSQSGVLLQSDAPSPQ